MHARVADLLRADAAMPASPACWRCATRSAGEDVWGATARILRTFSRVTRCALSPAGPAPATEARGADPAPLTPALSPS